MTPPTEAKRTVAENKYVQGNNVDDTIAERGKIKRK